MVLQWAAAKEHSWVARKVADSAKSLVVHWVQRQVEMTAESKGLCWVDNLDHKKVVKMAA